MEMENSASFSNDEESGWTMYLQDFNSNDENDSSFSSLSVADAASLVLNKSNCSDYNYNPNSNHKRLNLIKKKKARGADDDLEDTASSPANSPKVYDLMDQFNKNTKQKDHRFNICEEKGNIGSGRNGEDNVSLIIGRESELRKKGLCLVPLSTVVNYFG